MYREQDEKESEVWRLENSLIYNLFIEWGSIHKGLF
jgi:hypothetical protein